MQSWLLPIVIAVVFTACSDPVSEEPTATDLDPGAVTAAWIEAVAAGDTGRVSELVEPVGLAVVAAVENNLRSDELAGLLEAGFTDELLGQYWEQFRADFAVFRGSTIDDIVVGDEIAVPGAADYRAVALSADGAAGFVLLRRTSAGWQVDFAGTVGPALIGPLGEYLAAAVAGGNGPAISTAYREAVVPALDAAAALDPDNTALLFEAEYIRQLAEA